MKTKISIIIPVYNVEKYIERCIESILNQSLQEFEVIIVNDVTPDHSMRIVDRYAKQDSRFVVLEHKRNMGPMCARETGYKVAKGDYIMFCDSDDYFPEGTLTTMYEEIVRQKVDIVIGGYAIVDDNRIKSKHLPKLLGGGDSIALFKTLLTGEVPHSLCAKIYSRRLFDNYEYKTFEGQTNGEDAMLFYQITENIDSFSCIDSYIYNYYINSSSTTQNRYSEKQIIQIAKVVGFIYNLTWKYECLREYTEQFSIKVISRLVLKGYSLNSIKDNCGVSCFDDLMSFKSIGRVYKGIVRVVVYCVFIFNKLFINRN